MSHSDLEDDYSLENLDEVCGTLYESEERWRDRQKFLESMGYMLRPRLRPGWVPSWKGTDISPLDCEDEIETPDRDHLVDARRISDNSRGNVQDDEDPGISYMVMPYLHLIDLPMWELMEEVVDFVDQILEGLVFLHDNGIAHRDCAPKNSMMQADAMFPRGHHPVHLYYLEDGQTPVERIPRSQVPVKYYYIDFGLSMYIAPDAPKLALGQFGRDREVPELSNKIPYDPFKVDIFIIGNVLRNQCYNRFSNVAFLRPLIDKMKQIDPSKRPTAREALEEWRSIRARLGIIQRRWGLQSRKAGPVDRFLLNVGSFCSTMSYGSNSSLVAIVDLQG
ncbi:hypothetical protein CERSUDRAFT_97636 [Gelatoporia subvermispora B]|uniref:Protein kinase domain-containing protein n=1 Tax=Ceriporiopsis subvermispora (strain B) TaxID=914234 RepID=M2PES0_CERS8|nr:hypothetical protein CERSUDRAFT_97636 [Gelatoporia subvermispora B]